jgi:hypothetical protein
MDELPVISCADGTCTMDGFYMPDEWLIAPDSDGWKVTDRKWGYSKTYSARDEAIEFARTLDGLREWNGRR